MPNGCWKTSREFPRNPARIVQGIATGAAIVVFAAIGLIPQFRRITTSY
jgi:hypothetical protein